MNLPIPCIEPRLVAPPVTCSDGEMRKIDLNRVQWFRVSERFARQFLVIPGSEIWGEEYDAKNRCRGS